VEWFKAQALSSNSTTAKKNQPQANSLRDPISKTTTTTTTTTNLSQNRDGGLAQAVRAPA
jgi:hypothetical protein